MDVAKIKKINYREYEFIPSVKNLSSYQILHNYLTTCLLHILNILIVLLTQCGNFLSRYVVLLPVNKDLLLHSFHSG